ncbi:MAG TPA: hypothetical protein DDZ80_11170 [Cyanobacteria bacterium UBA8803]|nr:hypothetical protein [Cyanobacteria bacterium UBA9273]HBL59052.1 hypothetical protein [Cyanobacteria bacterium UBA8803]
MHRRNFIQYSAIGTAAFLLSLTKLNSHPAEAFVSTTVSQQPLYDWIFLYWMPYDNDLTQWGEPILDMLAKGVQSNNILVIVQSKLWGDKQLSRHIITSQKRDSQKLTITNSASEPAFAEYLNWAQSQFQAKKWAIAILGHGGNLDQISPDDHPLPDNSSGTQWMNIQKLSEAIANFNRQVDRRVELFFFQNCNKGTIEANYTLREAAKYTLSSQFLLGAPNYYYEPLLHFLGHNPEIHGGQLAEKIMEFEPLTMYQSYTAIDNQAMASLPSKINPVINSILAANVDSIQTNTLATYDYIGDRFVDAVTFFDTITTQSKADREPYNEFIKFLNDSLIYKVQKQGILMGSRKRHQNYSGLGIFYPQSKAELEKYQYLPVFSELKLAELFDAILVR